MALILCHIPETLEAPCGVTSDVYLCTDSSVPAVITLLLGLPDTSESWWVGWEAGSGRGGGGGKRRMAVVNSWELP